MINGFDIMCISTSCWEHPWGSRQQIMERLAEKNRVIFIEPALSVLHLLIYPWLLGRIFSPRVRRIGENSLIVYRPWLCLPLGYYFRSINLLNQRILLFQLRRLVKAFNFNKILLWLFEPTSLLVVEKMPHLLSLYQCIDSCKDEKESTFRRRCIEGLEEGLCRKCDVLLVSTQEMLKERERLNKNLYLVQSAVDEGFLGHNKQFPGNSAALLSGIRAPRIGLVGSLDRRIDADLIRFIAERNAGWSIVLIGHCLSRRLKHCLKGIKNIYMLGWQEHSTLPAFIKMFDVAIIPYEVNKFTKNISPIKVYEYLAFGKPVVASDLPQLGPLKEHNLIKICATRQDFEKGITEYLKEDSQDIQQEREEFARHNTWRQRVETISDIILKTYNA